MSSLNTYTNALGIIMQQTNGTNSCEKLRAKTAPTRNSRTKACSHNPYK